MFAVDERGARGFPTVGCLVEDVLLPMLRRGECVPTVEVARSFTDIGTIEGYHRANLEWLEGQRRASFCAADATLSAEVRLERSLVGARAKVTGAGAVVECVVWPDSFAVAPRARCIVTPHGEVAVP
jgi:hypothetical protein